MYSQSKQSDIHFAQGVEHFNNYQYDEAINSFLSCWKLDSLELPKNDIRRNSSLLWLSHIYADIKKDYNKSRQYVSATGLIDPYDRRKTRTADSLLSLAMYDNGNITFEEQFELLIESKKEYSRILGDSHVIIGNLFQYEALVYERLGQLNNQINSFHKSWEIYCNNYGFESKASLIILNCILKSYQQANCTIKDSICNSKGVDCHYPGFENYFFLGVTCTFHPKLSPILIN